MRYITLLFALSATLFSSTLLTYNIYEREDRVDIMLSFDSPYEGKIFQQKGANLISLILLDLNSDQLIEKSINSNIVQEFSIEPTQNGIVATLKSKNPIGVYASKTVDGFGLRIRSKLMVPPIKSTPVPTQTKANIPEKNTPLSLANTKYMVVIGVMFLLLIFLFWLKRKIKNQNSSKISKNRSSWLFKGAELSEEFHIVSQKALDTNNKVVLISFQGNRYLAITGTTNLLLDKFGSKGQVRNEDDFEAIFEQNRQKLDAYLKLQQNSKLDNYKQKVSEEYSMK